MSQPKANAKAIFLAALECEGAEAMSGFLDQACGGDAALRQRVEDLLQANRDAGGFLEGVEKIEVTSGGTSGDSPGNVIGPYKLLEQIGEGGMGTVWMAKQSEPVKRLVAVKLIKPGMDSRQVIARFEAERQALAIMDHPNIAKVFDGGATPSDRPYFVMELVKGVPITDFCELNQLTPQERLELFLPVCHAVQHSHQKGVIHRDLKPSNILVVMHDTTAVPKVIDFGIAKALGEELTDKSFITGFAQIVGTPLYMSPEQVDQNGLDIDTRSDIYSLGVILYELLTGTTPFNKDRFQAAPYDEIRRIIREEDPPRPSTRITTLDHASVTTTVQRKSDLRRLGRLMRGELDWVVMKALEKDRKRRYQSAITLAQDVERFLRDEPVEACPPSSWYRGGKFLRRHKTAMQTVGLALFFLTLLGIGVAWVSGERADRRARLTAVVLRALDESRWFQRADKWLEARAVAERAKALLGSDAISAELRNRVQSVLADVQMVSRLEAARLQGSRVKNGHFDGEAEDRGYSEAFRDYGIDVELLSTREVTDRIQASSIRVELAGALDAWAQRRRCLPVSASYPGPSSKRWDDLVAIARAADPDPWRCALRDAALHRDGEMLAQQATSDDVRRLSPPTLVLLAQLLASLGKVEDATSLLLKVRPQHPDDFWINQQLALCFVRRETPEWNNAIPYYTVAVALRPDSPGARLNLAIALANTGRNNEACDEYQRAIELNPDYAEAHGNIALAHWRAGRIDDAVRSCRRAIELGPDLPEVHATLGGLLTDLRRCDDAIESCRRSIVLKSDLADPHYYLGKTLFLKGQHDESLASFRRAIELNPKYPEAHCDLGVALWDPLESTCRHASLSIL